MTRVCFFRRGGKIRGFCSRGHSGYAGKGSDVVCAAVSACIMLVEEAVNGFLGANAETALREEPPGIRLMLPEKPGGEPERACEAVLGAFCAVLKSQAGEYGNYLKVRIRDIGGKKRCLK